MHPAGDFDGTLSEVQLSLTEFSQDDTIRGMDPWVTASAVVKRERQRRDAEARRAQSVREKLAEVAHVLANEFGVRKIVLFGSLTEGRLPEDSDVDLLVEGLANARYFEAMSRVWEITGVPPDIVPRESGRAEVVARALRDGEILYES